MGLTASIKVDIDRKPFTKFSQITISQSIFGHHRVELRVPIEEKENLLHDWSEKHVGKEITVRLGPAGGGDLKPLFNGLLTKLELTRFHGSSNEAVFYGVSASAYFDLGSRSHSYEEKSISEIAKDAFAWAGWPEFKLNPKPREDEKPPYYVQYEETPFRFLQRLADDFGEYFYYDGLEFFFGKPSPGAALELKLGNDLSSFDLSMQVQPLEFTMKGYDYRENKQHESPSSSANVAGLDEYAKLATDKSKALFKSNPTVTTSHLVKNKTDLDKITLREKGKKSADLVHFNGSCKNPNMRLASLIKVIGTIERSGQQTSGKQVSYGEFFLTKTVHRADNSGNYTCHFEAIPSKIAFPPPNPGVMQPQAEAQIATVEENHDPRGLGRVRVRCNWQTAPEKTPWIRVASTAGGKGQGFYFVPEKGDEVIVGFEHNNPVKPFVLGCVVHGQSKPGGDVQHGGNDFKNIATRSGISIKFDDGKGTLTMTTGAYKVDIGNGKILITSDGTLEINSKSDMVIKSGAKLDITSVGAMTISSDAAMKIQATGALDVSTDAAGTVVSQGNLSLESKTGEATMAAMTNAVVKGTATAKITAPAVTVEGQAMAEIKAAIVKLN